MVKLINLVFFNTLDIAPEFADSALNLYISSSLKNFLSD